MTDHGAHSPGRLEGVLRRRQFALTAETSPPDAAAPSPLLARAHCLMGLADAVNVTDGAGARAHMGALAAAALLAQAGIEPVLQFTVRDRNRLALQGDLLGAAALGVPNILCLHGDDLARSDQPEAKPVYDIDSVTLMATARRLRDHGTLPSGRPVEPRPRLLIGAADAPIDPPAGWQPDKLAAKVAAGADFVQTQFCMDVAVARRYARRLLDHGIAQRLPILIGVAPIPSAHSARWMREKLYGTLITDAQVARLEKARDPKAEGNRICIEVLQQLAEIPGVAGAHVMAPQNFTEIPVVIAESGVTGKRRKS